MVYRNSAWMHSLQGPRDVLTLLCRRRPESRFVLFAQGRAGSTLLESLLASHPRVHRSTEILSKRRRLPDLHRFLDAESRRSRFPVWGAKVKIHQLDEHGVEAREFLERLVSEGWRIVHLWRRDALRQAVSHFVRRHRGVAHRFDDRPEELRLRIGPGELLRQIEAKVRFAELERLALRGLTRAEVTYEDDLEDTRRHQATADRLFAFLGVESVAVSTSYRKVTPRDLPALIENWAEVRDAIERSPHARLLARVEPRCAGAGAG